MSHIYYWSPGAATQPTTLGKDDHYLRLGEYIATQEPADANIAQGGVAEGIFFYTSGKYSLKATKDLHQSVAGPVVRTVKTKDLTYTNEAGDVSITATAGGVTITASGDIEIAAKQKTSDDDTKSITVDAGSNDVYLIQGKYEKTVTTYESKIVNGHNHKTNIGLLVNTHAGAGVTTSVTCELTYSTFSVGFTAAEVAVKGIALAYEADKNSLTMIGAVSFTLVEGKKVFLDEEFCVFKNETRIFRFTQGIAQAYEDLAAVRKVLAVYKTSSAAEGFFKGLNTLV